jgi:VWFA-related protein
VKRALLALALLATPAVAARLELAVVSPEPGDPVFGPVTVEALVYPLDAEVERLDFYLDGLLVGSLEEPPWRLVVDAGEENRPHKFEVVAYGVGGETASGDVETEAILAQDEVDVELRQLFVIAEDRDGGRVLDLDPSELVVRDSGVPQVLDTVARGDVPFSAVLLVDASVSMREGKLERALAGARAFLGKMAPLDEARVVLFADRRVRETPFTSSTGMLELALSGATAGGGTALNDALYRALVELESRKGRRLVVLLSDGVDVESVLRIAQVRELAQRSQAILYWIRLGGAEAVAARTSSWRTADDHRRELEGLVATIEESGGRILPVRTVDEVGTAFASLLREVRDQYVLGYRPSVDKGSGTWHPIEVQVSRPGVVVRTRRGWLEE